MSIREGIEELIIRSHALSIEKGWYDLDDNGEVRQCAINVPEKLALIHSEVSEALEAWRENGVRRRCPHCSGTGYGPITAANPGDLACQYCDDGFEEIWYEHGKPEGMAIELADVIIRICDFAGAHNLDIAEALNQKHQFNETRPYRHGGKRA